ncbi:MAG: DUF1801 domain-containing protein [Anaerolineae bacterium]
MAQPKKPKTPRPTPEEFLAEFPADVQALANTLRSLVKATIPDVQEAVYTGWRLIGYRAVEGKRSVYFGLVYPTESHVVLGFEHGIHMADPAGILEGDGRQLRYITISRPDDIHPDILAPYIREAAEVAWMPKELRHARTKNS